MDFVSVCITHHSTSIAVKTHSSSGGFNLHNKFLAESLRLFVASLLSSLLAHRAPIWRADLICMRKSQNCPLHTHTWKWPPSSRRSHITQYQFYEFLVWADKLEIAWKKSIKMKYLLTNNNAFLESRPNIMLNVFW